MNLYELTEQTKQILAMWEEAGLTEGEIFLKLDEIELPFKDKLEDCVRMLKNYEADAEIYKREAEFFANKRKVAENKVKQIKNWIKFNLGQLPKQEIKLDKWKLSLANTGGSVEIMQEDAIPEDYFITSKALDKKKLLEDMKQGVEVTGASIKIGKSLRIK